jgi:hypothetical protein
MVLPVAFVRSVANLFLRRVKQRKHSVRRLRSRGFAETLEARCVMSGVSPLPVTGSVAAFTAVMGDQRLDTRTGTACFATAPANAPTYRLPAPIAADFSLDGAFSTDDFIAYFKEIDPRSEYFSSENFSLNEMFDLAKSMQLSPYEVEGSLTASAPCLLEHLTKSTPDQYVSQEIEYYENGTTPHAIVTHIGSVRTFHYRSALHFDRDGNLRTSSLDIYLPNSTRIYSRSQSEYDANGVLSSYATWIYDERGAVSRETTTVIFPTGGTVFQSTDVTYYDAPSVPVLRQIHYYDRAGQRLAKTEYVFESGLATTRTLSEFDQFGLVANETVEVRPEGFNRSDLGGFSRLGYLTQVHDAFRSSLDKLAPAYREVLRMNVPDSFGRLTQFTQAANSPAADVSRYVNLRAYYYLALDLAKALQDNNFTGLYERFSRFIDPVSGQWQGWFVRFMERERLTPLLEPLRITSPPQGMSASDQAAIAAAFRDTLGDNPQTKFSTLARSAERHVLDIQESMRRVKVQIRLLELSVEDETPLFDRLSVADKPDLTSLGIEKFMLLTGHFFFDKGPDGQYIRDRVSESVIQERVQRKLTDEDMFYTLNLEDWPLDLSLEEAYEAIEKLKEAANLFHKHNPNLMLGYYRLMPMRELNKAYRGEGSESYVEWQERNTLIAEALEDSIDILFPSVYVLHLGESGTTTEERWASYVEENIREARRIADGKPVLTFSAIYYHPNAESNVKRWEWLEPELVLYQLLFLRSRVDGVVLYNDLRTNWSILQDHGTVKALEIFERAKTLGKDDELAAFYDQLLDQHHDELLEKLELEKSLGDLRRRQLDADKTGNARLATQLGSQMQAVEKQIAGKFSIWKEIQAYMLRIDPPRTGRGVA